MSMRVLLDENADWHLDRLIDPMHEVATVTELGWSGMKNGDLLSMAEQEFDGLVTMDQQGLLLPAGHGRTTWYIIDNSELSRSIRIVSFS